MLMADFVLCYLQGLYNTKEQMELCIKRMEKARDKIRKDVAELDKMWEGPAHDTYREEWKAELSRVDDIIKNLREIIKYEDIAYKEYVDSTNYCQTTIELIGKPVVLPSNSGVQLPDGTNIQLPGPQRQAPANDGKGHYVPKQGWVR